MLLLFRKKKSPFSGKVKLSNRVIKHLLIHKSFEFVALIQPNLAEAGKALGKENHNYFAHGHTFVGFFLKLLIYYFFLQYTQLSIFLFYRWPA